MTSVNGCCDSTRADFRRSLAHWKVAADRLSDHELVASVTAWRSLEHYLGVSLRSALTTSVSRLRDGIARFERELASSDAPGVAHSSPGFTPWHREMVNRYEVLLQESNPLVKLLYWEWTTDPENSTGGFNFFTSAFMGASGRGSGGVAIGAPFGVLAPPAVSRNLSVSTIPPAVSDATVLAPADYLLFV